MLFKRTANSKKNIIIVAVVVAMVTLMMLTGIVFAVFYQDYDIGMNFVFGGADTSLAANFGTTEYTFYEAGDTCSVDFTVANQGSVPLRYDIGISIAESGGLEQMLLVYLDEEFVGMLSELCSPTPEYLFEVGRFLYMGETKVHNLKLELHLGAPLYNNGKNFKLGIEVQSSSLNNTEAVFVSTEYELSQAIHAVNDGNNDREIILADNITLTSDLTINQNANLNLYGKNLTLEGANISITGGTTHLYDTELPPQAIQHGTGGFLVNGATALLYLGENAAHWSDAVTLLSYDTAQAESDVIARLGDRLKDGVNAGDFDLLGSDSIYLALFSGIADEIGAVNGGILSVPYTDVSVLSTLTLTGTTVYNIDYKIKAGGAQGVADMIAANYLSYLNGFTEGVQIDLFLPIRLKGYDCSIEWWTSAPDVLSAQGRYTPAIEDTQVTLIAFVRVSNQTFSYTYDLTAKGQSNEARFNYFLTRYSDLLFTSQGQTNYLPVVDPLSDYDYTSYTDGRNLQFSSITYSMGLEYGDFLALDGNALTLTAITYMQYAQINISVLFEDGATVSGVIGVRIELGDAVFINDVFAYVELQLELRGDVLSNYYQNGAGNFSMPKEHLSLPIGYTVDNTYFTPGEEPVVLSGQTDPLEEETEFQIRSDYLIDYEQYITVTVDVLTITRQMEFLLPAAIHNDVNGFESADVFARVKSELDITDPLQDYILVDYIRNSALQELDLSGLGLDGSVQGLAFFNDLTALDVSGTQTTPSCANAESALRLSRTVSRLSSLSTLDFSYCNLASLTYLKFLKNLTDLNLKGNSDLYLFSELLGFGSFDTLNISNTGYHTTYSETVLELLYFRYLDTFSTAPSYYYTDTDPATEILFAPSNSNANYIAGLEYLYHLIEVPEIRVQYTHLATQIITDAVGSTIPVSWSVVDNANATLSITTSSDNGYSTTRIIRVSAPASTLIGVIKAMVSVNGVTVERHFYVTVKGA